MSSGLWIIFQSEQFNSTYHKYPYPERNDFPRTFSLPYVPAFRAAGLHCQQSIGMEPPRGDEPWQAERASALLRQDVHGESTPGPKPEVTLCAEDGGQDSPLFFLCQHVCSRKRLLVALQQGAQKQRPLQTTISMSRIPKAREYGGHLN